MSPRPMEAEGPAGDVGDDGVGTKLAMVEGKVGGAMEEVARGDREGRRGGGVPGSGRTSMTT